MNQTTSGINQYLEKNFWNRGEGTFGKILLWGAGIAAAVGVTLFFGPFVVLATGIIAAIFTNLLSTVVTGGVLFAIAYALSDPKFRGFFGFVYRTMIRKLWGIAVDMSPKAILDDIVDGLRENFESLKVKVKKFGDRVRATAEKIKANEEAMNHALQLAAQAKKQKNQAEAILQSREAQRYSEFNKKLKGIYKTMEMILRVLKKMREGAEFSLRDTESRVKMELMEHAALTDAASAVEDAMKIIKGDAHKNQLFNMAMEKLASERASALNEIEDFMEVSETFFSSVDLERAIADENSMKLLEEWERRADSMILGPGVKQDIINSTADPTNLLDVDEEVVVEAPQRQRVSGARNYFND